MNKQDVLNLLLFAQIKFKEYRLKYVYQPLEKTHQMSDINIFIFIILLLKELEFYLEFLFLNT